MPLLRRAVLLCTLIAAVSAVPGASAADFTFSGEHPPGPGSAWSWSAGSSWTGGVAPSGTVGKLTFPAAACTATACPNTSDDVAGLTAATLSFRAPLGATAWRVSSGGSQEQPFPLTLMSGLDAASSGAAPSLPVAAELLSPIVLGGDNTWSLDGAAVLARYRFAASGDHNLTAALTNGAELRISGVPVEVGPVTISGGGTVDLSGAPGANNQPAFASINGANGHPVQVTGSTLRSHDGLNTVGALSASHAVVDIGPGRLTASAAAFDATSTLRFSFDKSQLTSTGAVDLGGAALDVVPDARYQLCRQTAGTAYTLVSTTGQLSGTFGNAPENSPLACDADAGNKLLFINYHRTGPTQTVTATVQPGYTLADGATGPLSQPAAWLGGRMPMAGQPLSTLSLGKGCGAAGCVNDLAGLTVGQLIVPSAVDSPSPGTLSGNPITVGAGGLQGGYARLALPITLGAAQTWNVQNMASIRSTGGLSGAALTLTGAFFGGYVELGGANELAAVTDSMRLVLVAGASLNAESGNPVTITGGGTLNSQGAAAVGALHVSGSRLVVGGYAAKPMGSLSAASVLLDGTSSVQFNIASDASGSVAGTDYGQLSSAGAVELGGAKLGFGQDPPTGPRAGRRAAAARCGAPGTVYTLVSAQGALTGTFKDTPQGALVKGCGGSATYKIAYTPHTVTATVQATAPAGTPTPTTTPTPSPTPDAGPSSAEVRSALARLPLPKRPSGNRVAFTVPAGALAAGTRLTVALGSKRAAAVIRSGVASSLKVSLTGPALKQLRKKGKLVLTATFAAAAPNGAKATLNRKLTLKGK